MKRILGLVKEVEEIQVALNNINALSLVSFRGDCGIHFCTFVDLGAPKVPHLVMEPRVSPSCN